ncbi:GntR family transcriptional regulator [Clostridium sp. AM30-24]|nr:MULTISPECIES: GntR family transcriptional regulator [unclassified Clostridium]RHS26285.1 GntR family transcriptional regulator [Clostridium sp. AF12-28]RHS29650.1 GntR family transcriptional regulator [Clostridium sp. AF12-19]RHT41810.1 GntR family transcriptional regulator [Clostridium sp. AM30-24]
MKNTMAEDKIVADQTIATKVIEKLREDIINNRFETGSRITIKEISERYGVSPMPVREAFRTLEGEHFLEINPYKGATVLRIDEQFVRDVYGILRALECLLYETALDEIDEEIIQKLRCINEQIRVIAELPYGAAEYVDLNTRFHNTIMEHSKNQKALEMYTHYHEIISTIRKKYTPVPERIRIGIEQHEKLIDALEKKDALLVKMAVDEHIKSALENFMTQFNHGK